MQLIFMVLPVHILKSLLDRYKLKSSRFTEGPPRGARRLMPTSRSSSSNVAPSHSVASSPRIHRRRGEDFGSCSAPSLRQGGGEGATRRDEEMTIF
jgi:hypothetical protein